MKISVIGAGAMGGAIVEGLVKGNYVENKDICVSDPSHTALERFTEKVQNITTDNCMAAKGGEVVFVVVKPWLVETVIKDVKEVLDYDHQQLIVVAAGITGEQLKTWLEKDGKMPATWLCIPNIAIAQLASMTFLVPCNTATLQQTEQVKKLLDSMGKTIVTEEKLLGAGTTLASCGIAYAMRYIRAASEGGVELGFKADYAKQIVMQTMKGAVELLEATGLHPESAIDLVTTPGGVTIKGLNEMEHNGFTSSVIKGLKAGAI